LLDIVSLPPKGKNKSKRKERRKEGKKERTRIKQDMQPLKI
jgi:hypothetical protein